MTPKRLAILFCLLFVVLPTLAQQSGTPVTKDPQAVQLATASLAALSDNIQISDITLTGTATRTTGSDVENGNFTLKGLGTTDSRLDLNLSNGLNSEIRNQASTGAPQGFFIQSGGSPSPLAQHNCWTSAVWFFPVLSVLAQTSDPTVALSYIGQETRSNVAVSHIQFNVAGASLALSDSRLAQLGLSDLYIDATSNLPVAIVFNIHPDNDALTNIPVEIDFSAYQTVNGIPVPFRIQKLLNGTLFLDFTVQNAAVNSGLTDSAFASN